MIHGSYYKDGAWQTYFSGTRNYQVLSSLNTNQVITDLRLVLDGVNATTAWIYDGVYSVEANRHENGADWLGPQTLTPDYAAIDELRLDNDAGIVTAAWIATINTGGRQIQTMRHNGAAWSTTVGLSGNWEVGFKKRLRLLSKSNKTIVAWVKDYTTQQIIYTSQYDSGSGVWSSKEQILNNLEDVDDIRIDTNGVTSMIAFATEVSNDEYQIQSTIHNGMAWTVPQVISDTEGNPFDPQEDDEDGEELHIHLSSNDDKFVAMWIADKEGSYFKVDSSIYTTEDSNWIQYHFDKIYKQLSGIDEELKISLDYHPISKHFVAWWWKENDSYQYFSSTMNPLNEKCIEGGGMAEFIPQNTKVDCRSYPRSADKHHYHFDDCKWNIYLDENCTDFDKTFQHRSGFHDDAPPPYI